MTGDEGAGPRLLAGGNPQIPKGYGDAPVRDWLDAVPGWKQGIGRRVDAVVAEMVPGVRKAVKWNTPLYGLDGESWFLGMHCYTRFMRLTFFRGAALDPLPPGTSKQPQVRYWDVTEGGLDEGRLADWVVQASRLPGERM